ncbi:NADH dehydrogenase [ubiquinone] 1 subunit C2 [Gryllus bimaculatus]|nr:NADH dehydrogenase [ubiquinone] 1 subunit C2 [Gryllus bimaculatus]
MTSPLELLTPKDREEPLLSTYYGSVACGTIGFIIACAMNGIAKRPIYSGIQKHIGFAALGIVGGHFVEKQRAIYFAERDAVFRHYVELHPEDFPAPERKKYAEIFRPWLPVR